MSNEIQRAFESLRRFIVICLFLGIMIDMAAWWIYTNDWCFCFGVVACFVGLICMSITDKRISKKEAEKLESSN